MRRVNNLLKFHEDISHERDSIIETIERVKLEIGNMK